MYISKNIPISNKKSGASPMRFRCRIEREIQ